MGDSRPPKGKGTRGRQPSESQLRALSEAIAQLQASGRAELLAPLPIEHFMHGTRPLLPKRVRHLPLTTLLSADVREWARELSLSGAATRALSELLHTLAADTDRFESDIADAPRSSPVFPQPITPTDLPEVRERKASLYPEMPPLTNAEATERLQEAIAALRSAPHFDRVAQSRLGEFWDADRFQHAPFEEALTLQQLCDIPVTPLVEKRSTTARKIWGILDALERAAKGLNERASAGAAPCDSAEQELSSPKGHRPPQLVLVKPGRRTHRSRPPLVVHWIPSPRVLPHPLSVHVAALELAVREAYEEDDAIAKFIVALPQSLSAMEWGVLAMRSSLDEDLTTKVLAISDADLREIEESALRKVAECFAHVAPELSTAWSLALRSAGVAQQQLRVRERTSAIPQTLDALLTAVALRALGASPPLGFRGPLAGYWTLTPKALTHALNALLAMLPSDDHDLREEIASLTPHIAVEDVLQELRQKASFNEKRRQWVRRR